MEKLTPEQRSAVAKKAATDRWKAEKSPKPAAAKVDLNRNGDVE